MQKVMFLVAVARPQVNPVTQELFDGKIGMWPCTEVSAALRDSCNRKQGELEIRNVSMDGPFYKRIMAGEDGVMDAIKQKMPWLKESGIIIQQDGVSSHTCVDSLNAIRTAGLADGWNITVVTQPAQSPDLNILDLGFFRSLKSRVNQLKFEAHDLHSLIAKVSAAWDEYDAVTLDNIWKHLFDCYNCILANDGGDQYASPHQAAGRVPEEQGSRVDLRIHIDAFNRVHNMMRGKM